MSLIDKALKSMRDKSGYSIVELVIVLPIATFIIVVLVGMLFNQYVLVLMESSRSSLRAEGQALLTTIQDELLFTIEYGHDLQEDLVDPHEPSGGWNYNTDPDTLIIQEIALDGTRADLERNIVRQLVESDCESSPVTANPVALNSIIYFVSDNPDSAYNTLSKRTVTPTYDLCSIDRDTGNPCTPETETCRGNAKITTCPEASVGTGSCEAADSVLTEHVVDFSVSYFATNNVETSFPSAAEKVDITLVLGDVIYGRDVEVEVNHSIRKIN